MAVRTISTRLALNGEAEFKRQMSGVNSELKTLRTEMGYTEAAFRGQANTAEALTEKDRILRKEIEQQEEKVRALEQAVTDSAAAFGENDKRTDGYRQSLNRAKTELINLNDALQKTDQYLDEAKRSTNGCADSIDEFGREVRDAGDEIDDFDGSFGGMISKLGNLKGALAGGALAIGLKSTTDAIFQVVEATEEYRKVMGTLEVSSQNAGYTAEQTAETYERLYAVLGDTQTAATATANLQALQIGQEQLMEMTDSAIGAWSKYGDSIPIDSLTEAINETVRVGQVTGTFADALNWGAAQGETYGVKLREANEANEEWNNAVMDAKSAEDFFNLALQECTTQSDRVNLVLQALSEQGLSDAGKQWRELNPDIVASNEATAKLDAAMGRLGETLVPVTTGLKNFAADALNGIIDKAQGAWNWIKNLNESLNESAAKKMQTGNEEYLRRVNGSHALGLDRVPFDGYIAELHRDEKVLTAYEARLWDAMKGADALPVTQTVTPVTSGNASQLPGNTAVEPQEIVINLTAELDGAVLSRKQYRLNQQESRRRGTRLVEV